MICWNLKQGLHISFIFVPNNFRQKTEFYRKNAESVAINSLKMENDTYFTCKRDCCYGWDLLYFWKFLCIWNVVVIWRCYAHQWIHWVAKCAVRKWAMVGVESLGIWARSKYFCFQPLLFSLFLDCHGLYPFFLSRGPMPSSFWLWNSQPWTKTMNQDKSLPLEVVSVGCFILVMRK